MWGRIASNLFHPPDKHDLPNPKETRGTNELQLVDTDLRIQVHH